VCKNAIYCILIIKLFWLRNVAVIGKFGENTRELATKGYINTYERILKNRYALSTT